MNVKDRIQKYIDYKGINQTEFERSIGASKSYWRNTKNISVEVFAEIIRVYSDASPEWLLLGLGSMLKTDAPSFIGDDAYKLNSEIEKLKDDNRRLLRIVENLSEKRSSDIAAGA